jgi:hypothetical protein
LDKLGFDYYKFHLTDLGFHIFKNQFNGFFDVLHGFFLRSTLGYSRWKFLALGDVVTILALPDLDVIHCRSSAHVA